MGPPMLEVRNIHAGYGALSVLRGIDMTIAEGEVVAVLGSNGVGKTTLNNVMCGLVPHTQGEITFLGESLHGVEANAIVSRGLIQVPEGRLIFPNLTVLENLELGSYQRAKARRASNLEKILNWFPRLRERLPQLAGTLSGGEQQMLAIGRALVTNPKLLILDEATEGLAPLIREEIWQCLTRLRQAGQTLVVVDKYVNRLVQIADRHLILERGSVAWHGSSAELDQDRNLWHRYLGV